MAIFKSSGDRAAEKAAKEEQKIQDLLRKYGLESLTDPRDIQAVRNIAAELTGTGLMETGMTLSLRGEAHEKLPVYYQRAILEQNWIIIRQLDRICKLLATR